MESYARLGLSKTNGASDWNNEAVASVSVPLTKDVVESVVDCTFQVSNCFDMVGGYGFSGSDTAALAADDAATIAADRLIARRVQQSRRMSLIETCVSIAIGFVVSMVIQAAVLPAFGHDITLAQNFWITCIFTVASIVRGYLVRRYFVLLAHAS
jgi:hypothetical protein